MCRHLAWFGAPRTLSELHLPLRSDEAGEGQWQRLQLRRLDQHALRAPLPPRETLKPGASWKGRVRLPVLVPGEIAVTSTVKGSARVAGRDCLTVQTRSAVPLPAKHTLGASTVELTEFTNEGYVRQSSFIVLIEPA